MARFPTAFGRNPENLSNFYSGFRLDHVVYTFFAVPREVYYSQQHTIFMMLSMLED